MCDVYTALAIATVAISGATAATQQDQQRHSANMQIDAINANNAQEHSDAQRASDQLAGVTASQMSDRALDSRKQLARIQVINGEGGGGVTSNRLESEVAFNAGQDQASIADNFEKQESQLAFGGSAAARAAQAQINAVRFPSTFGTGLTIAGSAVGAYGDYLKTQQKLTPAPKKAPASGGD